MTEAETIDRENITAEAEAEYAEHRTTQRRGRKPREAAPLMAGTGKVRRGRKAAGLATVEEKPRRGRPPAKLARKSVPSVLTRGKAVAVPGHRGITDEQAAMIAKVRAARGAFMKLLRKLDGTRAPGMVTSPDLMLAQRHMEDAEYRAVRHITGGPVD